ncbi:MAG: TIR domain-containing protein [Syntrophorhabdaceae bacterium]|nr:TIR domain-containing protein [Syntrophorhabdaceae bacterium]
MGKKIFVSYKYADSDVLSLGGRRPSTVRDYVDSIESLLAKTDHVYKGESNEDDLSDLSNDEIWEKLKDRIFDSSITIVMISSNMKLIKRTDRSQWIPWEISYSLRETTRNDKTSHSNAVFGIVLPDYNGRYKYFIEDNDCCSSTCRTLRTPVLFNILSENMFNAKNPTKTTCEKGLVRYHGESSYILSVKWDAFVENPQAYITRSENIKNNINEYNICKEA